MSAPITKADEEAALRALGCTHKRVAQIMADVRAEGRGTWSSERPTAPGWWWVRGASTMRVSPAVVAVAWGAGDALCAGYERDEIPVASDWWDGAEWCPAVPPP